jgi:lysophospholipase L1-like esterase
MKTRFVCLSLLAMVMLGCSEQSDGPTQIDPFMQAGGSVSSMAQDPGTPATPGGAGAPATPGAGGTGTTSGMELGGTTLPMMPPATAQGGSAPTVPDVPDMPLPDELAWIGTWSTGPQLTEQANLPPAPGLANNTLRQKVFPTLSGSRVRVLFSNEFGNGPVTFNAAHIASAGNAGAIDVNTDRALAFNGMPSATIPAGGTQYSDPIDFPVTALSSVAITLQFGAAPSDVTGHPGSRTTSYLQAGNAVTAANVAGATTDHWYYITGIDVEVPSPAGAIVALGDSITDGRGSTTNANDRWPDALARRLQADPTKTSIAVLNQGIGGNAVLTGGLGPTAVARFQRDVLEQRGVRWVIVLEGVNDLGGANDAGIADRMIQAYQGFIDRAHAQGLLVYGVPILPFAGSQYDTPVRLAARDTINNWVRTSGSFDAVIDLDAAVRDPANQSRLLGAYDSGDALHLNPTGYQAMGAAIDLSLFVP